MGVRLSSRPSPRYYRIEIGKVVEKADWGHNGETTSLEPN